MCTKLEQNDDEINLILVEVRSQGHIVVVTEISGIVATLLENSIAATLLENFTLPLRVTEGFFICHIKINDSREKENLSKNQDH